MKTFSILYLSIVLVLCSCGSNDTHLIPVAKGTKWGYINKKGKEVIPFQFLSAREFVDGLALVCDESNKFGYIGTNGDYIIEPSLSFAEPFSDGLAAVSGGYIDKTGKRVIEIDLSEPFKDGYAVVRRYKQRGYINKEGEFTSFPNASQVKEFSDNMAALKSTHWGYINKDLKIQIKAQFFAAAPFSEGLAAVSITGDEYGYIDNMGDIVIAPQFKKAREFNDGIALVLPNNANYNWAIDKKGAYIFECPYNMIRDYKDGMAAVYNFGEGWGFIDTNGKCVVTPQYELVGDFKNGVAAIMVDGKYGFIDKTGKLIVEPIYDNTCLNRVY